MPEEPFVPPALDPTFVGRERELKHIYDLLTKSERPSIVKITGTPGIGKTALARQVVAHRSKWKPYWVTLASSSLRPEMLRRAFHDYSPPSKQDARNILVIFDGVSEICDISILDEWLRAAFAFKGVRGIITTSRYPIMLGGHDLVLPALQVEDATHFLHLVLTPATTRTDIASLVAVSKGHPLALTLLARLLHSSSSDDVLSTIDGTIYEIKKATQSNLLNVIRPGIIAVQHSLASELKNDPDKLYSISPRQFEQLLAELFAGLGWKVTLTPATKDGGKDVVAYIDTGVHTLMCVIEGKRFRKDCPVGVHFVRALHGTLVNHKASSAILCTTSSFSAGAKAYQKDFQYQLTLKDYTDIVEMLLKHKT